MFDFQKTSSAKCQTSSSPSCRVRQKNTRGLCEPCECLHLLVGLQHSTARRNSECPQNKSHPVINVTTLQLGAYYNSFTKHKMTGIRHQPRSPKNTIAGFKFISILLSLALLRRVHICAGPQRSMWRVRRSLVFDNVISLPIVLSWAFL